MNSAIPPSTITAPSAIAIAAPPDSELSPVEDVVATVGTAVVVVGVVGPEGSDGENGLLPLFAVGAITLPVEAASTAAGDHSTTAPTTSHTTDRSDTTRPQPRHRPQPHHRPHGARPPSPVYRSEASGCSIAGVSGAVRYGSSFS